MDLPVTPEVLDQLLEDAMNQNKPHLIEIEKEAQKISYGEMNVVMYVRAGVINKMEFVDKRTWLKEKR